MPVTSQNPLLNLSKHQYQNQQKPTRKMAIQMNIPFHPIPTASLPRPSKPHILKRGLRHLNASTTEIPLF